MRKARKDCGRNDAETRSAVTVHDVRFVIAQRERDLTDRKGA